MKDYIRSLNGVKIPFLDVKPQHIKVNSIFLHLAKTCRYHGMVDGWYSNAEHSIIASFMAKSLRDSRAALVHDFGEHITADVAGPVKKHCPDYDHLCSEIQARMNLHFLGYAVLSPAIKEIDLRLTATEQRDLRNSPPEDWDAQPYNTVKFQQFEWREAYEQLKERFFYLFPDYQDAV